MEKAYVWNKFNTYWNDTEWNKLTRKKIVEILENTVDIVIPEEIVLRNPKTGREFYTTVKKVLNPNSNLDMNSIEKEIFDMYIKENLGNEMKNRHCRICKQNDDLAGPISFFNFGSNFNRDKYKIVFVGKNTWFDMDDYIEYKYDGAYFADARKVGSDSLYGKRNNNSPYWGYLECIIQKLYGKTEEGIKNIAITNIIKCNTTGAQENSDDKTEKHIRNNCINSSAFEKEIEIMKPRRIIFLTGKDYDEYIRNFKFGCSKSFDEGNTRIDEKIISWSRILFDEDKSKYCFVLRTSHPQGKNKKRFVENIINWINNTMIIEDRINAGEFMKHSN